MSIEEMAEKLKRMSDETLSDWYELYNGLISRGVYDEVMLSLLEKEMNTRDLP